MQVYELSAKYDSRASFYNKAQVIETKHGDEICPVYNEPVLPNEAGLCSLCNNSFNQNLVILQSYNTRVAYLTTDQCPNTCKVLDTYSQTTLRHIKEFLAQNGFTANNSKQIMADYGITE